MPGWEEGDWRDEDLCKFEESNLNNNMGLEFYDLSHPWGLGQPCWPYFEDVKIERLHTMAKSGVLTQQITTVMHSGTHIDAPAHVVPGTAFMDEVPLPYFFGTGVVVSIPKGKWEVITPEDLENGRALAMLLTKVLDAYPVPVEEIVLVGHSMGGLVVRSAAHYAREHDEPWIAHLRHVACIGAPHLGVPLEKAVNLLTGVLRNLDAAGVQVPAELLDSRSAGLKDLRYGYTVDEEWAGKDPDEVFADARRHVPLVDGVGYYFLAATISRDPEHSLGELLGDLMVRLPSASGEAPEPARRIHFSSGAVFPEMNHLHIANHPDVYEASRDLLAA